MLRVGLLVIMAAVGGMAGCAETSKEETASAGRFYVPATMMMDQGEMKRVEMMEEGMGSARIDWYALLPEGETMDFPIIRAEKVAYGAQYRQSGRFTVYTNDWQRISGPRGSGWRVTNSVQNWSTP